MKIGRMPVLHRQFLESFPAVHQKDVEQAVIVVIKEGNAARHCFDKISLRGRRILQNKIQTLRAFHVKGWRGSR